MHLNAQTINYKNVTLDKNIIFGIIHQNSRQRTKKYLPIRWHTYLNKEFRLKNVSLYFSYYPVYASSQFLYYCVCETHNIKNFLINNNFTALNKILKLKLN